MARIFTDGAECAAIPAFWDQVREGGDTISIEYSIKRTGNCSYKVGQFGWGIKNIATVTELWYRFAVYIPSPYQCNASVQLRNGATTIATLEFYNNGHILLKIGTTAVATSANALLANTWYLLEWHYKMDATNGVTEVKIDGVLDAQYTGNTNPSSAPSVDNIYHDGGLFGSTHYIDDLALNDASGTTDNSWCGDGRIIALKPDGNGDTIQWVASAGSNYQCVDEGLPGNGDTDYVYTEDTDKKDLYTLENPNIPSTSVIRRVWVTASARKTTSDPAQLTLGLKTGGTEYWGSAQDLLASYKFFHTGEYTKNPNTNAEWTLSDINNLQVGIKS